MTPHDEALAVVGRLVKAAKAATPGKRDAVLCDGDYGEKWWDIWSGEFGSLAHLSEGARPDGNHHRLKADAKLLAACDPDTILALCAVVEAAVKLRCYYWQTTEPRDMVSERRTFDAALARLKERG